MSLDLDLVRRIRPAVETAVRRTPVVRSEAASRHTGGEIFWKLECLQATGSFKVRGPLALRALQPDTRRWVTASAGNHGLGVAFAWRGWQPPPVVFVPRTSPMVKRDAIKGLGAELHVSAAGNYDDTEREARQWAADHDARFVSPFDDDVIMAGNGGTLALEILEQLPAVATLVVPVGGGGLASGLGCVVRALQPGTRLLGVQSEATSAMHRSLAAGRAILTDSGPPTLADGLEGGVSEGSFAYLRRWFDDVVTVSEAAIADAVRWLWRTENRRVEGSAAVVVAALLGGTVRANGDTCGVLTGRNIDAAVFQQLLRG